MIVSEFDLKIASINKIYVFHFFSLETIIVSSSKGFTTMIVIFDD